jgi:hypothetical protein
MNCCNFNELPSQVYYQLYTLDGETPSKVAFMPEEPSLGRIRADAVALPHTTASIRRHISRVEDNPALASAGIFADRSCETSMNETYIPILTGRCPGLTPDQPMALVIDAPSGPYAKKIKSTLYHGELNFIVSAYAAHGRCDSLGGSMANYAAGRGSFH